MSNKGIQAVVYEWVLQNPWRTRADAGREIASQYMVTERQVSSAHERLYRKGILQKKYGGFNTAYAVKGFIPAETDEHRRQP